MALRKPLRRGKKIALRVGAGVLIGAGALIGIKAMQSKHPEPRPAVVQTTRAVENPREIHERRISAESNGWGEAIRKKFGFGEKFEFTKKSLARERAWNNLLELQENGEKNLDKIDQAQEKLMQEDLKFILKGDYWPDPKTNVYWALKGLKNQPHLTKKEIQAELDYWTHFTRMFEKIDRQKLKLGEKEFSEILNKFRKTRDFFLNLENENEKKSGAIRGLNPAMGRAYLKPTRGNYPEREKRNYRPPQVQGNGRGTRR